MGTEKGTMRSSETIESNPFYHYKKKEPEQKNFMVNPFSGLSTIEALAAAEKFLEVSKNSKNINSYEAMIRRLQFENSQPRAILTEKGKKIIKGWKELESFLE